MSNIDWNQVFIQAAISAMQGIQESGKLGWAADVMPDKLAEFSVNIADAMVKKLKEILE